MNPMGTATQSRPATATDAERDLTTLLCLESIAPLRR